MGLPTNLKIASRNSRAIFDGTEIVEEVCQLLHDEGIALREAGELFEIAIVMRERMARLIDAEFRNRRAFA
jgi:hypothetical protein